MELYALTFFQKVLSIINYFEKPKTSTGTISKSTSKLSEKINTTLQFMIDGMDEKVYLKVFNLYKDWIGNCSEEHAIVQISSITARLASKNPEKIGELIPVIIKKLMLTETDDNGKSVKVLRNLSDSFTNFNVKVLKELVFYC
jgi:hypothetical protein